jgi:hypothetical protein
MIKLWDLVFGVVKFCTFFAGGSSGGSAPTSQTVYQQQIPTQLMPLAESTLGAAANQMFNTDSSGNITSVKPYTPYSTDPSQYVAGFTPLQQQAQQGVANLQVPGQFGQATGMTNQAAMGSGMLAGQEANAGNQYNMMATNPGAVGAFMNPYVQQSLQPQLNQIAQQGNIAAQQAAGAATSAGAFGGSRSALAQNLAQQNAMQAEQQAIGQGYNTAYNNAQNAMQYGAGLGLQGQQAAMSGLGQVGNMANQLGNLGTSQLAAQQGILAAQNAAGATQQQQQQNIINQAVQNYATAQQYPMMQLGSMMNLIQGTPIQTSSTSMYQVAPSLTSQLGGLGATALGVYGASSGKKKGGKIEEKKYASGGLVTLALKNVMEKA